ETATQCLLQDMLGTIEIPFRSHLRGTIEIPIRTREAVIVLTGVCLMGVLVAVMRMGTQTQQTVPRLHGRLPIVVFLLGVGVAPVRDARYGGIAHVFRLAPPVPCGWRVLRS